MNKIYRPDSGNITIDEAKKLLREALPTGDMGGAMVYWDVDAEGEDSEIELRTGDDPEANPFHAFLNTDFVEHCKRLGISTFLKYRPAFTFPYKGDTDYDSEHALRFKDFERLADAYGLEVVIGQPPPPREDAPSPATGTSRDAGNSAGRAPPAQPTMQPLWALKPREQIQRMDFLRQALYEFLVKADKTKPLPTPRDVIEAWQIRKPVGIARLQSASVDYESTGIEGERSCDLVGIRERIKNMTVAPK